MKYFFSTIVLFCLFTFSAIGQEENPEPKVGDKSPELRLMREDSSLISLQDIDADYVLLLFWHYKCSHCQKALTKIDKFLEEEKPQGLKILSIYPFAEEVEKFWDYVKDPENLLTDPVFIHCTDYRATTRRAFSPKSGQPPLMILIDKEGKILGMNLKAAQLKDIWKELKK